MPVRWITGILRVVDHGYRDDMLIGIVAGQDAPAATGRPNGSAFDSLTGEIHAGRARRVDSVYLGRPSVCIHEDAALLVGRFKPVGYSHAEQPLFIVIEDGLIEGLKRGDLIDDAGAIFLHKDVARSVPKNVLAFAGYPE